MVGSSINSCCFWIVKIIYRLSSINRQSLINARPPINAGESSIILVINTGSPIHAGAYRAWYNQSPRGAPRWRVAVSKQAPGCGGGRKKLKGGDSEEV